MSVKGLRISQLAVVAAWKTGRAQANDDNLIRPYRQNGVDKRCGVVEVDGRKEKDIGILDKILAIGIVDGDDILNITGNRQAQILCQG